MTAVFQTARRPCLILTVTVLNGENISLGWWNDQLDTPDPYVKITLPLSPNGIRKTKVVNNDPNPVWNESFEFYMDPDLENTMNVTLLDGDVVFDDVIQTVSKKLDGFEQDKEHQIKLAFNKTCYVYIKLFITECKTIPKGVRYSVDLCDEEKAFKEQRKQMVFNAMKMVLGEERGPKTLDEVPTIGILGSGGGFRAMTGLSGTTCALKDIGVLDCATYFAGLSGSSWYISTLYSHPHWPKIHPMTVNNEIRKCIENNWVWMFFKPSWLYSRISDILEKRGRGQPISFTDLFGYMIGDLLLVNRENPVLSDQKKTLKDGSVPMPLLSCVHVKKAVSAEVFSEWVDVTPYEIGMLKYGTYINPEFFCDKYFCGVRVKNYPEPPLHFIQGFCGSAFTILLNRVLESPDNPEKAAKEMSATHRDDGQKVMKDLMKSEHIDHVDNEASDDEGEDETNNNKEVTNGVTNGVQEEVDDESTWEKVTNYIVNKVNFLKTREGRAAKIHNFLRGLKIVLDPKEFAEEEIAVTKLTTDSKCKRIFVCDGGLVFNSPYPILLRKERNVDLILSFDYSAREKDVAEPFGELIKAELWAKNNNLPFPPINHEEQYRKYGLREYYVFKDEKDPKCPIVIHFPLVNNQFKTFKAPGVPRTTPIEVEEGKLLIFEDPEAHYSTFNFHYPNKPYDRLVELCNFNVKVCKDAIYDVMAECVERKRKHK